MHARSAAVVLALALAARAQAQATDPLADHLVPGDYLRVGVNSVAPISAQGSLKDWNRGVGLNVMWENWDQGRSGVGHIGYGFMVGYALLPFDGDEFVSENPISPFGKPITATAKKAGAFQLGVNIRYRISAPYIMPWISLGLGFIDWHPGEIKYTTATTTTPQTAKQEHRSGGAVSIGAGLDKHIYDRFGVFAQATYTYGYTSFGQGLAGSGSTCLQTNCDLLKNIPFGSIGGGLRVRFGN